MLNKNDDYRTFTIIQEEGDYDELKKDWIFLYGSERLKKSFVLGYDSNALYLRERIKQECLGFRLNTQGRDFTKVDTPESGLLKICNEHEQAFIATAAYDHGFFLVIENYLGKYCVFRRISIFERTNLYCLANPRDSFFLGLVILGNLICYTQLAFVLDSNLCIVDLNNQESQSSALLKWNECKNKQVR